MGCVNLNGANSYIKATITGIPYGDNPRTIEFYFKTSNSNTRTCLLSYGSTQSGTPLIYIGLTDNKILFEAGSMSYKFLSDKSYNDGEWHSLRLLIGSSSGSLYLDNTKVHNINGSVGTDKSDIYIGQYFGDNSRFFNGYIDEFRIWNKKLSEEEMFKTYNKKLKGTEDGLIVNYSFESTLTDTITDVTGVNNGKGYNLTYSSDGVKFEEFLIKKDGQYYSIYDEYYDSTNQVYNPIADLTTYNFSDYSFSIGELFEEITINNETFKPIDKFDNFQIISLNKEVLIEKGLKSNKLLVTAKESFSTKLAKNIDFFKLVSTISGTSSIKMALSTDEGITWNVYDTINNEFVELDNSCPLKDYSTLYQDELVQWNTFRDEVYLRGIDSTTLDTIDFNSIKTENMMFAYVLDRDSYESSCEMSKLQYQFDAEGSYALLGTDGASVKQNSETISISPKKEMDLMKINIGSSGNIIIGSDEEVNEFVPATSEDIQQILKEW